MRAALGSFKVKLVVYFVLLSLLPIAAAFWGFASVAGQSETRRVDARLQAGLRSALTAYQERVDAAQNDAKTLARDRTFQIELQKGNVPELREMLRDATDLYVVAAGNAFHVGRPPILAAQRPVQVYTRVGLVGTVIGYVPYDTTLARCAAQPLGPRADRRARGAPGIEDRGVVTRRERLGRARAGADEDRFASPATATGRSSLRPPATAPTCDSPCSAPSV